MRILSGVCPHIEAIADPTDGIDKLKESCSGNWLGKPLRSRVNKLVAERTGATGERVNRYGLNQKTQSVFSKLIKRNSKIRFNVLLSRLVSNPVRKLAFWLCHA